MGKYLKFNPVSVDKPGMYRWFQSKHASVNQVLEDYQKINNCTLSKTAKAEMVRSIETRLCLPKTMSKKDWLSLRGSLTQELL